MNTLAYNLRTLHSLTDCVHRDLETYLESPADYDAAEYFADVADAASEAHRLVDEVLNHIARDTRFVRLACLQADRNIWLDEEDRGGNAMNWKFLTADEITKWYGERCPDIEPGCVLCNAWLRYDTLRQWEFEDINNRIDCLENESNDEEKAQ